jgi:hypothetical protein
MEDTTKHPNPTVDQAILAGTALLVAITDDDGPGTWNPFDTVMGVVLLAIVAGFYRPPTAVDRRSVHNYAAITAAVAALSMCLIADWPVQHLMDHYHMPTMYYLHCAAMTGSAQADCVAQVTSSYFMPAAWLVLTPALYCIALFHRHRVTRRQNLDLPSPRAVALEGQEQVAPTAPTVEEPPIAPPAKATA